MLGHEYARDLVADHLRDHLPTQLQVIRSRLGVTDPPDPAAYLLADAFPLDASQYPVIVIQSTSVAGMRAIGAFEWIVEYDVVVVVGCRSTNAGDWEDASRQRDRLQLAVREVFMRHHSLGDDGLAEAVTSSLVDQTGEAAQDVQSRPLSAGQIGFRVRVVETLDDNLGVVETADVTIDPVTTDPDADITPPDPPEE